MVRVAINGFGRIGRCFLRAAWHDPEVEIVAINDLGDIKNLAYLLQYDTVYRAFGAPVSAEGSELVVGAKRIKYLSEKDPTHLPWKDLAIDVVVEATGVYDSFEKAAVHLASGARRVVLSAPAHGHHDPGEHEQGATVLMGINEEKLGTCQVSSNASCTTNAASPVISIMHEKIGVSKAILSTTHAYTASQRIVDSPSPKDLREGRAGAMNIIPSSTGAAIAVTKALPALLGKFDGISLRVPVVAGSVADITFITSRDTTVEEVNRTLEDASKELKWKGIFTVSHDPLVSSDIIGQPYGSIADLQMTRVVDGNLVKILAWYDNEMGYTYTLVRHVKAAGAHIQS